MKRSCVFVLPAYLMACSSPGGPPDINSGDDTGPDAYSVMDAPLIRDSTITPDRQYTDASYEALLCDGLPPETGIPCVLQDHRTHGGCGSEGRVVYSGGRCTAAEGAECGPSRGAFDTLEECAVNCVAAGVCAPGNLVRWPAGGGELESAGRCDVEPWVCESLLTRWYSDPSGCAVFGPFAPTYENPGQDVVTTMWPHPEEWEIMRMISLMPWELNDVICIEDRP